MIARTLYDKLWDSHVVRTESDGTALLYIDRHLVHEVTSPQAFEGLQARRSQAVARGFDRRHRRPQHADAALGSGHRRSDLAHAGRDARRQHARARRQGLFPVSRPAPGHRARDRTRERRDAARHDGRLRRLAHQHARRVRLPRVRHRHLRGRARARDAMPAHQADRRRCASASTARCRSAAPRRTSRSRSSARSAPPAAPATRSSSTAAPIRALSMEGRMTVCNMAIEAGARAGMVAVDDTTIAYLQGPAVRAVRPTWDRAVAHWRTLHVRSRRAVRSQSSTLDAATIAPQVTWGTSPEMVTTIEGRVPDPDREKDPMRREGIERALVYMGLEPNTRDDRHPHRQGVHRLVHQFAHRGSARRGGGRARPAQGRQREARDGRSGLRAGEGAGRARRARPRLHARPDSNGASPAARCAWR